MTSNRRDFIKKSSLLSVGMLGTSFAMNGMVNGFGPNETVNIGVIGTGGRGSGLIPYLNDIEGLNIVACCDILPFRLENGLNRTDKKVKGYTNYKSILE